jgi:subtilisin family serine protease
MTTARGLWRTLQATLPAGLVACAAAVQAPGPATPAPQVAAAPVPPSAPAAVPDALSAPRQPVAPAATAYLLGLMPLEATGVSAWRIAHPAYDGRGVLIGILDSGVDPGVAGLQTTSTGQPKILDLRNFSGEGDVALERVHPDAQGSVALPGGLSLQGAGAVRKAAAAAEWYGGVIHELPFGDAPAADFNGNGSNRDSYGVVVARTAAGWVAFIDTNGDGSLVDETPIADYRVKGQTFTFALRRGPHGQGPITGAVNLRTDAAGRPSLSLVLDTAGHGTHVAGIASGHDIYGVRGFDGVAPGAQVIALKIANDARGGLSTTGSMIRAMEYAAQVAAERRLPLVLNMSFGVGNMEPGAAVMDSLVDAFLLAHPGVVFAISAGNEGPGIETVGFPGSARYALTAGATYPAAFAPVQFGTASPDVMGWWSSRGGETDKPDIVTPGLAYSTVPAWNTGDEVKGGTSMAAPQAAGVAALLLSAMRAESRQVTAAQVIAALRATARHLLGESETDEGYGVPRTEAAYQWLRAGHAASRFDIRVLPPALRRPDVGPRVGGAPQVAIARPGDRPSAAYRRGGLLAPGDTVQRFAVTRMAEGRAADTPPATFRLSSNRLWLRPEQSTVTLGTDGTAVIEVRYDPARLAQPGRYVGVVNAEDVSDTAAGPAFRLVSEIVVPEPGPTVVAPRKLAPGRAARFYVDVPSGAAGLAARLVLADTSLRASLSLYEPSGRQSRTKDQVEVGGSGGATGSISVTANDLTPGVWEAVVQAMPGDTMPYTFTAAVPPLTFLRIDSAGAAPSVTVGSSAERDTSVLVSVEQLGVATDWQATMAHGDPYTRTFAAPEWATQAVLEVQVTPDQWNTITDFGLTLFDRDGAQLGQGPMNYDFNRVTVDLPAKRGPDYPVTVELFPAFARPIPPASFAASVRLAFVGEPRPVGPGGAPSAQVTIPARGSQRVEIPAFTSLVTSPDWSDLVRIRVAASADDWIAIEREIGVRKQ